MESNFKKGDYIINKVGNMAVFGKTDKKGYDFMKYYYSRAFDTFTEGKEYFHMFYEKFWRLCTEEEKEKMKKIIEERKEK